MGSPNTKSALVEAIDSERGNLLGVLDDVPEVTKTLPGACESWSVKDILAHMTDWEQRFLGWYEAGLRGEVPKIPDAGYTWRQLPALNQAIYEKHRHKSLAQVQEEFDASFKRIRALVEQLSEHVLFTPGYYAWTGDKPLAVFLDANTASHYRWAKSLIGKFLRKITKSCNNHARDQSESSYKGT